MAKKNNKEMLDIRIRQLVGKDATALQRLMAEVVIAEEDKGRTTREGFETVSQITKSINADSGRVSTESRFKEE